MCFLAQTPAEIGIPQHNPYIATAGVTTSMATQQVQALPPCVGARPQLTELWLSPLREDGML